MRITSALPTGTIVRFRGNPLGYLNRLASVVRCEGEAVYLHTEGGGECLAARHEVAVVRNPQIGGIVSLRAEFPYGKWTCPDGREVLFNRDYKPIWQRSGESLVAPADRDEWVRFFKQEWFYEDGHEPWRCRKARALCIRTLAAWGIRVPLDRYSHN